MSQNLAPRVTMVDGNAHVTLSKSYTPGREAPTVIILRPSTMGDHASAMESVTSRGNNIEQTMRLLTKTIVGVDGILPSVTYPFVANLRPRDFNLLDNAQVTLDYEDAPFAEEPSNDG